MKQWYETLFENYANTYDNECFVQGTKGECDFIENEIKDTSLRILDVGCGTGRHSIELARRGYHMLGIDLSKSQIDKAIAKAQEQHLSIDFQQQDARHLPFRKNFDVAIMLCEGGFPLMESDEMNFQILQSVSNALKEKSKFIFTTLNGLFPLFHSVKDFLASQTKEGNAEYDKNTFDLMTFRDHNITTIIDDSGTKKELVCNERYYVPSEISWLLKSLGFTKIDIYGARIGEYSREHKLSTDDFEMLVIAER